MEDSCKIRETNPSARMDDYAIRLWEVTDNHSTLVRLLLEPKAEWLNNLWLLSLPQYRKVEIRLADFLDDYSCLDSLWTEFFYIILSPLNPGLNRRFSKSWINREQIVAFINDNISADNIWEYSIIINQFYPNKYWWSIIINDDWIIIEFTSWKQSLVSWWKLSKDSLFHARKTPFEVSFRYSFEDKKLRRIINRTLKHIPHDWDKYLNWYYEFIVWENWEIIFIDARLNRWYIW